MEDPVAETNAQQVAVTSNPNLFIATGSKADSYSLPNLISWSNDT
jgi:hypothetical protein